jgi:NADPH-dependent curcumin reductase
MAELNTRVVLLRRPEGALSPDCFSIETEDFAPLEPGQVRVAVDYVSVDAFIRTTLRDEGFHQTVPIGGTIGALGAGHVMESASDAWAVGDAVKGGLGAQTHATLPGEALQAADTSIAPLSAHLGALGLTTGMTAWVGVRNVGRPQPGETFVVSAAAGAVGSIAGQIAKIDGARVIGIAGGERKTAFLVDELGFDAAIDYKADDVSARLRELAPDGVDVFFDNVGGRHPRHRARPDRHARTRRHLRGDVAVRTQRRRHRPDDVPAPRRAAIPHGGLRRTSTSPRASHRPPPSWPAGWPTARCRCPKKWSRASSGSPRRSR